ncbi:hyaluronan synthase [Amphibacillus marinus]|uniref:Hyaluronan synthase n=1 Tax=Amphibacillus marinus TaxID=872970 RepID=A0A1H8MYC9_9BACI|nr:glycosyltransferase [Amphibacillus marinus]SEO22263.1 hyaluronan synthase [Amphibacillus marinus]
MQEKIVQPINDRRLLSFVPGRNLQDRRGLSEAIDGQHNKTGTRFVASFAVAYRSPRMKKKAPAQCCNLSRSGMLMKLKSSECVMPMEGGKLSLTFTIPQATLQDGFEGRVVIQARVTRVFKQVEQDQLVWYVAVCFAQSLDSYFQKGSWSQLAIFASLALVIIILVIIFSKFNSFVYLRFYRLGSLYSLMAATFLLSRYLLGLCYRNNPITPNYLPSVSIIIPAFNEELWIERTILSCMNQDYPIEKLEVIVVDDCSTDRTALNIQAAIRRINKVGQAFQTETRLSFLPLQQNIGKRGALLAGVKQAQHELVTFVDSDSFLEPDAILHLVQPFQDPKMGGVTGRTEVENKHTNMLTKLQAVRYYIAFRIMKAAESIFDAVTCLSGPISCYRKSLILKYADAWLNQRFFGQKATFGDDRSMTNFILQDHRTCYQDRAICSTIVPSKYMSFLKQQMRWKRSWLRESLRALKFIWKKEPFMQVLFLFGLIVPIISPIIVFYNLIYIPISYLIFPKTFVLGIALMALLISFTHLLFKRSKLWLFGIVFVIIYEFVLLWQMPYAWLTFWKSTWGTRATPEDVLAIERRFMYRFRKNRINEQLVEEVSQ